MSDQHELSVAEKVRQKNLEKKQKEQGVQPIPEVENLPQYSYGTCLLNNQWYTVEVRFNPETKQALVTKLIEADGKTGASERLKIEVANWVSSFQAY